MSTCYHCSPSDTNDIAVPFTRFRDKGASHGLYNIRRHYFNIMFRVNDACGCLREWNVSRALKRFYSEFHEKIKQNLLEQYCFVYTRFRALKREQAGNS